MEDRISVEQIMSSGSIIWSAETAGMNISPTGRISGSENVRGAKAANHNALIIRRRIGFEFER